jgi:hypothetical protein
MACQGSAKQRHQPTEQELRRQGLQDCAAAPHAILQASDTVGAYEPRILSLQQHSKHALLAGTQDTAVLQAYNQPPKYVRTASASAHPESHVLSCLVACHMARLAVGSATAEAANHSTMSPNT